MPINVSDEELDQVESGREAAVIVRSALTKKAYALIPQKVYDEVRPLLQHVATRLEASARNQGNGHAVEWTPAKNARRIALINKKHDEGLSSAEKNELNQLASEADKYRDETVPHRNEILELILAGIKSRGRKPPKQ